MYNQESAPTLGAVLYRKDLESKLPSLMSVGRIVLEEGEEACAECLAHKAAGRGLSPQECLLLTASDAGLRAAAGLHMAAAAYLDEAVPNQTYEGAGMLIEGFEEVDERFLLRVFQRYHHIPWTIAETRRCVIRELTLDDLDALAELYDRPGITCRMGQSGEYLPGYIEPLYPMEEEREYQKHYIEYMYRLYGYGMWLVLDRESGTLIGRAGLENREYPQGVELELGYLIHPDLQGRGLATEVCSAIIDYARDCLECRKLNILTEGENAPSVALAQKLGFSYAGDTDVSGSLTRRYVLFLAKNH